MRAIRPTRALRGVLPGVLVLATPLVASGDGGVLSVKVAEPSAISFDVTALGRATHSLRITLGNPGRQTVALTPLAFRFRPIREGVAFSCEDPQGGDDRWPSTLEPGGTFTLSREVSCETPLPGRYDVEVRGRPRKGPEESERTYATVALNIEPGANPPVRLPWDGTIHAGASVTREMRPTKDPNKARVVVAMINGTRSAVALAPVHGTFHVTRRGMKVAPCPDRQVDLAFTGDLAPGRTQGLTTSLSCELSEEAIYDVDITIANAGGARVKLATQSIRVGVLPPPPPRPEGQAKIQGGM